LLEQGQNIPEKHGQCRKFIRIFKSGLFVPNERIMLAVFLGVKAERKSGIGRSDHGGINGP
jgi:hypothetical protein